MSIYYNPETQEKLSRDKLKNKLNTSIGTNTEQVHGWYLLYQDKIPDHQYGQVPLEDSIELRDGKYYQTYKIVGTPRESSRTALENKVDKLKLQLEEKNRENEELSDRLTEIENLLTKLNIS